MTHCKATLTGSKLSTFNSNVNKKVLLTVKSVDVQ